MCGKEGGLVSGLLVRWMCRQACWEGVAVCMKVRREGGREEMGDGVARDKAVETRQGGAWDVSGVSEVAGFGKWGWR